MTTGYYLQDHPNRDVPQYGWERAKIGEPGVHLSGAFGVHTTENLTDFFGPDYNAENVAQFISTRADHGGYHIVSDADSIVPLVHPRFAAWADTTNNAHALSVSGSLQAARWLEMTPERRRQVVVNMGKAAAQIALVAVRDDYLAQVPPARRISAQQAIDGTAPGFYGHGETNPGTRYDPGAHFDWALFLSSYAAAVSGGITPQSTTPKGLFMSLTAAQEKLIFDRIQAYIDAPISAVDEKVWGHTVLRGGKKISVKQELADAKSEAQALRAAVTALAKNPDLTADQITAAVKAGIADGTVTVDVNVNGVV